jgi:putative methionine-R-sulfoxide reductase with GAF domain
VTEPVALEAIMPCFGGLIPSPFATCSPDGVPNVTYMSIVQYVDADRVALSRQFFNKTRANLDANPRGTVRVVDPTTLAQYDLDLEFLHSEAQGQAFEAMRASLEAIASQTGMAGVFRLRGVDVHRVVRCAQVGGPAVGGPAEGRQDPLLPLEELSRRLAACRDYEEATAVALEGLEDLFGFSPATLLVRDPHDERLFAVSGHGYAAAAAGAEVRMGEGVIGTAAASGQVVCVPNLTRSRVMQAALRDQIPDEAALAAEIPLPGLPGAQSVAAVPIEAQGTVIGALYLESERAGTFGPHNQRLLRIVGRHLGAVLRGLGDEEEAAAGDGRPAGPAGGAGGGARSVAVTYYGADDSVFVDDAYVIKGAAGRILWKMLRERATGGRFEFTNRELRLDESLALPAGANNLEARLLMLRKRLAGGDFPIGLERVGRGRLELRVEGSLRLKQK